MIVAWEICFRRNDCRKTSMRDKMEWPFTKRIQDTCAIVRILVPIVRGTTQVIDFLKCKLGRKPANHYSWSNIIFISIKWEKSVKNTRLQSCKCSLPFIYISLRPSVTFIDVTEFHTPTDWRRWARLTVWLDSEKGEIVQKANVCAKVLCIEAN